MIKAHQTKGLTLFQNMAWNSIGSMTYLVCQWLVTLVVVRLSQGFDNAGILSLAMSVTAVFHCLALYNMRSFQVSDLSGAYPDGVYTASRLLLGLCALLAAGLYALIGGYTQVQRWCILLYMGFKLTEAFCDVIHGAVQKRERMDIEGKSMILRGIATLAAFAVVFRATGSLPWAIAAMALSGAAVILFFDIPQSARIAPIRPAFDFQKIKGLIKACFWLFFSSILSNAMLSLPKIILEQAHGSAVLGVYSAVAAPTLLVQVLSTYIFNPLLTSFTYQLRQRQSVRFRAMMLKCFGAILGITALALAASKFLGAWGLNLLYGVKTAGYEALLYPLVVNTALTAFVWFLNMVLIVMRRIKALALACVAGLAACAALCFLLIGPMGMWGACWAGIISQGIQVAILLAVAFGSLRRWINPPERGNGND